MAKRKKSAVIELTPRQIREQAAYEARKALEKETKPQPQISRAMETRNFYRRQAGWPLLKEKNNV